MEIPSVNTLVELLKLRASNEPSSLAYQFFYDFDLNCEAINYEELDKRANEIAYTLLQKGLKKGDRVLLIYNPGIDLIVSFFGCLYAGMIALPIYPPTNFKLKEKLKLIIDDANPSLILTNIELQDHLVQILNLEQICTDNLGERLEFLPCGIDENSLAYLQYTSGSTSEPKGVKITHRNLIDNVKLLANIFFEIKNSVSWLPPYHDMGLVTGIILPLSLGIPARLLSPGHFLKNPIDWLKIISKFDRVYSVAPNFAYGYCAEKITSEQKKSLNLEQWLLACNGAEPVRMSTIEHFYYEFAECGFKKEVFCPCYGLAEATLLVSLNNEFNKFPALDISIEALKLNQIVFDYKEETTKIINVGKMYQLTKIVDTHTFEELPDNQIGEIWVSGKSVSEGYWNKEEESAEIFKAHIVGDTSKINYLRTGDLGFINHHNLYVTGRIKDLIILNGKNYYPQDLELIAEQSHPLLRKNCLVAFAVEKNNAENFALVCETEKITNENEWASLVAAICTSLFEEFSIAPQTIAFIPAKHLPKTTSGKVQRQITKQALYSGGLKTNYIFEQKDHKVNEEENSQALYFKKHELVSWILNWINNNISRSNLVINKDTSFAEYGFDSIALANFISDFNLHSGLLIDSLIVINYPTPAKLAEFVVKNTENLPKLVQIKPVDSEQIQLSYVQQRLLFLQNLNINAPILNIGAAFKITGSIDIKKFKKICKIIVDRHEILRTIITEKDKKARPELMRKLPQVLKVINASNFNIPELKKVFIEETLKPYNLQKEPLFRLNLYKISDTEAYFLITAHHIIVDSWSLMLFVKELLTKYEDETAGLPILQIQYYDFANWQVNKLKEYNVASVLDFWTQYLKNVPLKLNLPIDSSAGKKCLEATKYYNFILEEKIGDAISGFCKEEGITPFILFFTAFQILLTHYSNQKDFLIGVPVNGRINPETKNLIGLFVKPLPIRVRVNNGQNLSGLLHHNQKMLNQCYRFQEIPREQLAKRLNVNGNVFANPLFQVTFIMQNTNPEEVKGDLIDSSLFWSESGLFPYDLTLEIIPRKKGNKEIFEIILKYDKNLFNHLTIAKMEEHYECLIHNLIKNPAKPALLIPFITKEEKNKLLFEWNRTEVEYPSEKTLHGLFEEQVEKSPNIVAIDANNELITYQELNDKANQLAHYLLENVIHEEEIVGILQQRNIDLVISILAVLKVGGAFLLINPEFSQDQINQLKRQTKIKSVLTKLNWDDYSSYPTYNPDVAKKSTALAYCAYKKDSKNFRIVLIEHINICDRLYWFINNSIDFQHFVHLFPFYNDDAIAALFWPLLQGATVLLPSAESIENDALHLIKKNNFTILYLTPTLLNNLLAYVNTNDLKHIQYLILAKELFTGELLEKIKAIFPKNTQVWNAYGMAEGTIISTCATVEHSNLEILPIGKPISNTEVFILNEQKDLVPIGIAGELYIGGKGLARGYLNNQLLEKQKFITNPFATPLSKKLYKTGDIVRFNIDGNLIFIKKEPSQS